MDNEILTKTDLADFLRCEIRTVNHLLYSKQLPRFKVGREYRFLKSEIIKWISSNMERKSIGLLTKC